MYQYQLLVSSTPFTMHNKILSILYTSIQNYIISNISYYISRQLGFLCPSISIQISTHLFSPRKVMMFLINNILKCKWEFFQNAIHWLYITQGTNCSQHNILADLSIYSPHTQLVYLQEIFVLWITTLKT